jgi:hypothetical protein
VTPADFGVMMAVFGATFLLCAVLGWRTGNAKADVALLGGSGVFFSAVSAALFAA